MKIFSRTCEPIKKGKMELNIKNFSILIKSERKKSGLSQVAFSKKLGISNRALQYYEAAEKLPEFDNMVTILNALGYVIKIEKVISL